MWRLTAWITRSPRGRGNKTAILFEAEPIGSNGSPEVRHITYQQLKDDVCKFANGLKKTRREKGRSCHDLFANGARGRRLRCWLVRALVQLTRWCSADFQASQSWIVWKMHSRSI